MKNILFGMIALFALTVVLSTSAYPATPDKFERAMDEVVVAIRESTDADCEARRASPTKAELENLKMNRMIGYYGRGTEPRPRTARQKTADDRLLNALEAYKATPPE